jgi:hypothetical protein
MPGNFPASNGRNQTLAKYLARFMLFWAHCGALWRAGARFQIKAKYVGAREAEIPSDSVG